MYFTVILNETMSFLTSERNVGHPMELALLKTFSTQISNADSYIFSVRISNEISNTTVALPVSIITRKIVIENNSDKKNSYFHIV